MDILISNGSMIVMFAALVGFFMAWGIGANDVANAMGTSVGTKSLTIKQAVIIAMIFEFAGAYFAGGEVTSTIRKGIIDAATFADTPELLVFGMLASLLAAGTWLMVASIYGWPVSTTHSIVGAIVGFALVSAGVDAVQWGKIGSIVGSWIVTPMLSGVIAYLLFISTQQLIFNTNDPLKNAKYWSPFYIFLTIFVLCLVTISKGLKHVGLHISTFEGFILSVLIGGAVAIVGGIYIRTLKYGSQGEQHKHFANVERVFVVLMVVSACAMAFAHGSNDVANAIGPLAAIVSIVDQAGDITAKSAIAWWILPLGGIGIVIGLAMMGKKVMATVGSGITELTPSRGFAAQLATASTVVIASGTGMPISTTQTLVGAVMGVGLAGGIAALNLNVVRNIVVSWVITLPIGAGLAVIFYWMIKGMFS